ncbi:MAG: phosphatidate cytidylyltransferase [Lachnospiraceae bacterium]|jgi:phosphatidate cytidylyltransferase|nr:phosphatidate cytidylyltransferase [Lachnospiraceae bacterium]
MKNKDSGLKHSFWVRFGSSTVLMIITILSMVFGGYVLFGVLFAITLIGLFELYRVVGVQKSAAGIVGYLAAAALYFSVMECTQELGIITGCNLVGGTLPVIIGVLTVLLLAVYVLAFPKFNSEQITMVFFGFFYVALTISYIYRLRISDAGAYSVWLIFISSWGADTMAYLTGILIGKHKIAPVLSPKKTVEGCIGGVVGATLIGLIYSLIFKDDLSKVYDNPVLLFTIVSAVASVVSMIGDMAASAIKRNKDIKDYGSLIPGHGGILDRFDSVIFVAPIIYFLLKFIG